MATWRQALEVVMTDEEIARLLAASFIRRPPAAWRTSKTQGKRCMIWSRTVSNPSRVPERAT
jgi:hypothetical protein